MTKVEKRCSNLYGISNDRIFVDEAHYYKNLFLYTKMRNVGIAQTEAQKSPRLTHYIISSFSFVYNLTFKFTSLIVFICGYYAIDSDDIVKK